MGVHHIGVVTDDWDACHKFYVDVMGGKPTTIGDVYTIPLMEFQDDIFDAAEKGMTNAAYGVPDFQSKNSFPLRLQLCKQSLCTRLLY